VLSGFETRFPRPNVNSFYRSGHILQLPTTHKAFVAKLLNQTNTNSLTSIIPLPPTPSLSGKHAHGSMPSLAAYDLGLPNAKVDPLHNAKFQRLVNSEQGQTLFARAKLKLMADQIALDAALSSFVPLVVMLMMWFDGWDPNGSSKGNRSPVWSGLLTLVIVNFQGRVMSVATYPFAAGPGKADHDAIFEQILVDVRALQAPLDQDGQSSRWFHSRLMSQMVLVHGKLFCIWQNQPARRQERNLLGGNSNNHTAFGTSCYVKHIQTPIAACSLCRKATLMCLDHGNFDHALVTGCLHCTNWSFPTNPKASLCSTSMSDVFPNDAIAGQDFNHGGGQMDTPLLISAWREACAAVVAGQWTDATVKVHLKTLCVNKATVKALIEQCKQHVLWQDIAQKTTTSLQRLIIDANLLPALVCFLHRSHRLPGFWGPCHCMWRLSCTWQVALKRLLQNLFIGMPPRLERDQHSQPVWLFLFR
jgi:hypothetical protein